MRSVKIQKKNQLYKDASYSTLKKIGSHFIISLNTKKKINNQQKMLAVKILLNK